jgi:long-chain acyl-CoA synthetase
MEQIKSIYKKGSLIIVIDDKSAQSALSIIGAIIAEMDVMILDERHARKTLKRTINEYKVNGVIGSIKSLQMYYEEIQTIGYGINCKKLKIEQESEENGTPLPLILLNTSGSSGNSKFVALTHKNLESNTQSICKYLNPSKKTRTINSLPLSYSYGLSVLNTTLAAGGMFSISKETSYIRQEFWNSCEYYGITDFSGVPKTYSDIIGLGLIEYMPRSICQITQAGGRLATKYQQKLLEYSVANRIKLFIMYGQTEASARLTYLELTKDSNKIGSVGKPIPGVTLISENENFKQASELIFKGKNISLGYIDNIDKLKKRKDVNKGTLKTGDIGTMDKDGFIYIKGRVSRFCKINGKRISLDSIESSLNTLNIEAICISDDIKITVLCPGKHDQEMAKQIKKLIKETTDTPTAMIDIIMNKEIIYTDSGKVAYGKIKEQYYAN